MSRIVDATTPTGHQEALAAATAAVGEGRLVVIPTDTVYGVGCDAFDATAVAALLAAKGRGRQMPPPVLVGSPRALDGLAQEVPAYARALADACWPGALTLIVLAQPSLSWDLGETNGTVALRMPDEPFALELLSAVGPMAVTSANLTGSPAATTIAEAAAMLGPAVSVYVDAGPSRGGAASTIVDCTGPAPVVVREGALPRARVEELLATPEG